MKIKEILKNKGPEVFTIGMDKTLESAIKILINNNIGVLLVLSEDAKIAGILSERDILHHVFKNPDNYNAIKVRDMMTKKVIIVEPEDEIEYAESAMTNNHVRHLPVVNKGVLVGLISIGDVVKAMLTGARFENKYLMDYISGNVIK
jgi:CBS domain-containing protein